MNKRATSWLLAAFIALSASYAVPSARVQNTGASCAIVWIAQARLEQRVTAEKRARPVRAVRRETPLGAGNARANVRLFTNSLYQRPPPASLA